MKKLLIGLLSLLALPALAQDITNHAVPIGGGPGAVGWKETIPGAAGQVLTSNGAASDPSFQSFSSASIDFLCSTNNTTLYRVAGVWTCLTGTNGGVVYFNSASTITNVAGTATQVLHGGTPPSFGAVANADMSTMADSTIKGRAVGAGTGAPQDLTGLQAEAILQITPAGTGAVQRALDAYVKAGITKLSDFAPINDANRVQVNVTTTSGSPTLTVGTATFASTDCQGGAGCTGTTGNKVIVVGGAGVAGAPFQGSITAFTSSTVVTVSANFSTSLAAVSQQITYGTDNATVVQNWLNQCMASKNICFIDPGNYVVGPTTININNANGAFITGAGRGRSTFYPIGFATTFFLINTDAAVYMSSFGINGVEQPNGTGITQSLATFTGPTQNYGSVIYDMNFNGGSHQAGNNFNGNLSLFSIIASNFNRSVSRPITLGNQGNPLSGAYLLTGNNIATNKVDNAANSGIDCVLLLSGGNLQVTNNLIHFCSTSILIQQSAGTLLGDIFVTNNSFEQNTLDGIHFNQGTSTTVQTIQITNNDFGGGTPTCIQLGDGTTGWLGDVTIASNTCYPNNSSGITVTNSMNGTGNSGGVSIVGNAFRTGGGTTTALNVTGNAVKGLAANNTFFGLNTNVANASPTFKAENFVNGHSNYVGVAPTLTAGCNGAGSSVTGTDPVGTVVGQTAAATTCTLTFAQAYAAAPHCVATGKTAPLTGAVTTTTTTLVVNFASVANFSFSYACWGI